MKTKGGNRMRDLRRSPLFNTFISDIELIGLVAGLRPVAKKEGPDASAIMGMSPDLAEAGYVTVRNDRTGCAYISRDSGRIDRLMELENREFDGGSPELRSATIREIGVLLGYPECCAAAFAAHLMQDDAHVMGAFIRNETAGAGSALVRGLPWQLNFLPPLVSPVFFYPCGARCGAALALADKYLAAIEDVLPGQIDVMRDRLTGVVMAAGRWDFVMLHGTLSADGSVSYDARRAPADYHPVPTPSAAFAEFLDAIPERGTIWVEDGVAVGAETRHSPPTAVFHPGSTGLIVLEYV